MSESSQGRDDPLNPSILQDERRKRLISGARVAISGGGVVAERLELRGFYGCRDATDQAAEIAGGLLNSLLERLLNLVSALQDQVVRATHGRLGSVRVRESTDRGGELLVVRPRERFRIACRDFAGKVAAAAIESRAI